MTSARKNNHHHHNSSSSCNSKNNSNYNNNNSSSVVMKTMPRDSERHAGLLLHPPAAAMASLSHLELEGVEYDLLTRTSWTDADTAYREIKKDRADGNQASLWLRSRLQAHLYEVGCSIQRNPGKILFVGLLVLATFCVGLKSARFEYDLEKLWIEEGGRVTRELDYIRTKLEVTTAGSNQIVIQTPGPGAKTNILWPDALLAHVDVLRQALQVEVELYEQSWSLQDICVKPSVPGFNHHFVDQIFENIMPCTIITPLDCFWEGSKLLGPSYPMTTESFGIYNLTWANLNPVKLMKLMREKLGATDFPFDFMENFMARAGVTTAYQERPCLNPDDAQCPDTAPNRESRVPPDVGATLTGGCYGFATNYMHWPEDLVVGGIQRNRSGTIMRGAALQSIVQIMDDKNMFELHDGRYNLHNADWSVEKAHEVIEAWQTKFANEVQRLSTAASAGAAATATVTHGGVAPPSSGAVPSSSSSSPSSRNRTLHAASARQRFNVFTFGALGNVLRTFSRPNPTRLLIGALLLLIYVCAALVNVERPELSQACVGFVGVLLLALSITAAFGLCALLGLTFNATTTQVLPFFALGLGSNSIFMLAHTLNKIVSSGAVPIEEQTGECLKRTGVTIILSNASLVLAFVAASLIPIPALRCFSLQAAVLLLCSLASVLLLFPAVFSVDLRRRAARRLDLFCCIAKSDDDDNNDEGRSRDDGGAFASDHHPPDHRCGDKFAKEPPHLTPGGVGGLAGSAVGRDECAFVKPTSLPLPEPVAVISVDENRENEVRLRRQRGLDDGCFGWWSLSQAAADWYVPFIHKPAVRALVLVSLVGLVAFGLWGALRIEDGLELSDLIPKHNSEYEFLRYQQRYFGMYEIFAVTQANFEYPTNQRLLYEYHDAFTRVEKIVKNDDGGLPEFWLQLFRDWLLGLQKTFDVEWNQGYIRLEGWSQKASNDAILAYKLLVQTGRVDNPVDKSLLTSNRLVNADGIINPKAFYNYLTAWYNNDPLAYASSKASLVPQPKQWDDIARSQELKIFKSSAIHFAQLPFYLRNLNSTREITATISQLRSICAKFEERGLPNFPTGVPLVFWEQYLHLRFYLAVATALILTAVFVIISSVLLNVWPALLIVLLLAACVLQALGALHVLGLPLSAVPAVLIVVSVGMGVDSTLHLTVGYLTALGSRTRRVSMALEYMSAPIVHGTSSTLLGIAMLAFSEFDFVIMHFSQLLSAIVVIYAYNGFVVLPVLLTLMGPPGELVPRNHRHRIDPPSPQPSPLLDVRSHRLLGRSSTSASRAARSSHASCNRSATSSLRDDRDRVAAASGRPHSGRRHSGLAPPTGAAAAAAAMLLLPPPPPPPLTRGHSELSLSTITEEPTSYQSTSPEPDPSSSAAGATKIVVEPEITVETTMVTNTANGHVTTSTSSASGVGGGSANGSGDAGGSASDPNPSPTPSSSSTSASSGVDIGTNSPTTVVTTTDVTPQGTNVTTKVTTTAKLKVELHTRLPTYANNINSGGSGSSSSTAYAAFPHHSYHQPQPHHYPRHPEPSYYYQQQQHPPPSTHHPAPPHHHQPYQGLAPPPPSSSDHFQQPPQRYRYYPQQQPPPPPHHQNRHYMPDSVAVGQVRRPPSRRSCRAANSSWTPQDVASAEISAGNRPITSSYSNSSSGGHLEPERPVATGHDSDSNSLKSSTSRHR